MSERAIATTTQPTTNLDLPCANCAHLSSSHLNGYTCQINKCWCLDYKPYKPAAAATVITEECPECGSDLAVGETCIECEPMPAAATDKATVRPEYRMDMGFSVFNCHVNSAKARANAEFIAQFGQENYDKHIAPLDKAGIMTIFHKRPTQYTSAWVALVTAYVNENRIPEPEDDDATLATATDGAGA